MSLVIEVLTFLVQSYLTVGMVFAIVYTVRLMQTYPREFHHGNGSLYAVVAGFAMIFMWANILWNAIPRTLVMTREALDRFKHEAVDQ